MDEISKAASKLSKQRKKYVGGFSSKEVQDKIQRIKKEKKDAKKKI